jgi:hypothetical protein
MIGEEKGRVRLAGFPVLAEGSGTVDLLAHGSHLTNVAFLPGGHLVTVGGREPSIIQWDL